MVTRKEFVRQVSAKTNFTQNDIQKVLDAARSVLIENVRVLEHVKVFDGLSFEGYKSAPRTMKSPFDGSIIEVPEKVRMKMKVGKTFKEAIEE